MRHSFATWCSEGDEDVEIKPEDILGVGDWLGLYGRRNIARSPQETTSPPSL
jgi:hypothetical protein